jgi:sugar lactone lactonase YvrE
VDSAGNLYFVDAGNHRVRKVSSAGVITTVAGNGVPGFSGDGGQAASAQLNNPHGLAMDAVGNLYIADSYNHRIRKITTTGIISTVAGNGKQGYSGDGGPAASAQLFNPNAIAVDSSGNLYIADTWNHSIRKVTNAGIISAVAGNGVSGFSGDDGPAASAQLNAPYGITVDSAGNLYIAEYGNHRIRKVTANNPDTQIP